MNLIAYRCNWSQDINQIKNFKTNTSQSNLKKKLNYIRVEIGRYVKFGGSITGKFQHCGTTEKKFFFFFTYISKTTKFTIT